MLKIFVVLSCEIVGKEREPACPRIVTPLFMFDAMIFACSDELIETVPPVVYPAGIETVPAFVEIVPDVEPLLAIEPLTDPEEPKAVFPVKRSDPEKSAAAVS